MYKVDDPDSAAAMPAPSASSNPGWFQEGNPGTGTPATGIRADWLNGITAELLSVLAAAGIAPAKNAVNQVLLAIEGLIQANAGAAQDDTGAANAYVVTLAPAPAAYAKYQTFTFKAANSNTGASTLNVNALGAKAVVRSDGSALAAADIIAGQVVTVRYDGTSFQLVAPSYGFDNSTGVSGWQRLPSGHIFQWGSVTTSASADVTWTYPRAFPNQAYALFGNALNNAGTVSALVSFGLFSSSSALVAGWTPSTGARISQVAMLYAIGK